MIKNEKKQNIDKNVTILALLRESYNFIDILNSNVVTECTEETQAKYLNSSNQFMGQFF